MNLKQTKQTGFTIVELLIVIVVIGILASITVVAFNGIQNRAYDTSVQSDLNNFAKTMQIEGINNGEIYPLPTTAMGIKASKTAYSTVQNTFYYCKNDATQQFAMSARSRSGKTFKYISSQGLSENSVALYGESTCQLIGLSYAAANATYGYDQATAAWVSWVN